MPYTYEYPRPMLTVDAVVFRKNKEIFEVLLIQRKHDPYEGMWALPGGYVDMEETVEEAVVRELQEETGLQFSSLKQLHTFSTIDRDPRGRTVSVIFYGTTEMKNSEVKGGDDANDARWFRVDNLPELGFDHIEAFKMAFSKMETIK